MSYQERQAKREALLEQSDAICSNLYSLCVELGIDRATLNALSSSAKQAGPLGTAPQLTGPQTPQPQMMDPTRAAPPTVKPISKKSLSVGCQARTPVKLQPL